MSRASSCPIIVTLLLCAWLPAITLHAQVPTKCLEIESILVDACIDAVACPGSQEGQNEMVRFRVGPDPIALSEIEVDWPNNSWNGLVQNATTASLTDALNATILGCGWLLEPPGGIIPAGASVLMVTSTEMCTAANSFANLNDTLYIVFQAPGNIAGHFANHNNSTTAPIGAPDGPMALRTLIITYLPAACSDTATYDRPQLVNVFDTYGGPSNLNDGASVLVSWPGVPVVTYVNLGCQAPFVPVTASIADPQGSLCSGGIITLTGIAEGNYTSVLWQGGTGSFGAPDQLVTTYTAGIDEQGLVELFFCAVAACGEPVCSSILVPAGDGPVVTIQPSGPTALCPGESVFLEAQGADTYTWSTNESGATIEVSIPGVYSVTGTNSCGQDAVSIEVTQAPGPTVTIDGGTELCAGTTLTLIANGADDYVWSTTETTASITVNAAGTYTVVGTNFCGQGTASITVLDAVPPTAAITGDNQFCPGGSATLNAEGGTGYLWNTGEDTATIIVDQSGTYSVTVTNACGSDVAQVDVTMVDLLASFMTDPLSGTAPLDVTFTNTSSTGAAVMWDFGDGNTSTEEAPTNTFQQVGTYTVVLTATLQGCTATAEATITVNDQGAAESSVSVPNVFSPNNDGVNDVIGIIGVEIVSLDLSIYNRWGQEMARLERPNQVWDARTFAGEPAPEGTYFYVLKAEGADGNAFAFRGSFTLVR